MNSIPTKKCIAALSILLLGCQGLSAQAATCTNTFGTFTRFDPLLGLASTLVAGGYKSIQAAPFDGDVLAAIGPDVILDTTQFSVGNQTDEAFAGALATAATGTANTLTFAGGTLPFSTLNLDSFNTTTGSYLWPATTPSGPNQARDLVLLRRQVLRELAGITTTPNFAQAAAIIGTAFEYQLIDYTENTIDGINQGFITDANGNTLAVTVTTKAITTGLTNNQRSQCTRIDASSKNSRAYGLYLYPEVTIDVSSIQTDGDIAALNINDLFGPESFSLFSHDRLILP